MYPGKVTTARRSKLLSGGCDEHLQKRKVSCNKVVAIQGAYNCVLTSGG